MTNSGKLHSQTVAELFRSIAQARKTGILILEGKLELCIASGKIISAKSLTIPNFELVHNKLIAMSLLINPISCLSEDNWYDQLLASEQISADEISGVSKLIEEDLIYSIPLFYGIDFNFISGAHTGDASKHIELSPTQLLLDFVELESSPLRQFDDDMMKEECFVIRADSNSIKDLSMPEQHLLNLVGSGIELERLRMQLPLNRLNFELHILSIEQKGFVDFDVMPKRQVEKQSSPRQVYQKDLDDDVSLFMKARYFSEQETSQLATTIVILAVFLISLALVVPKLVDEFSRHLSSFSA